MHETKDTFKLLCDLYVYQYLPIQQASVRTYLDTWLACPARRNFRAGVTALSLLHQALPCEVRTCGRSDECICRGGQQHSHRPKRSGHRRSHRERISERRNFLHVVVAGVGARRSRAFLRQEERRLSEAIPPRQNCTENFEVCDVSKACYRQPTQHHRDVSLYSPARNSGSKFQHLERLVPTGVVFPPERLN